MEKKRLTDAEFKYRLTELFNEGNTTYSDCKGLMRAKYEIGNDRFTDLYHAALKDWQETKDIAQRQAIHSNSLTSLTIGLKSKLERQLKIQSQIESIERFLVEKKIWHSYFFNGEIVDAERYLTPQEIAKYHSTIKELNGELSKMAGEYSPAKTETNLTQIPLINITTAYQDPKTMTTEELRAELQFIIANKELQ